MAASALTTDTSILTSSANDLGFEQIFGRQIEALGLADLVEAAAIITSLRPERSEGPSRPAT